MNLAIEVAGGVPADAGLAMGEMYEGAGDGVARLKYELGVDILIGAGSRPR